MPRRGASAFPAPSGAERTLGGVIGRDEIDAKAVEFGLHAANVQRDYVFGWLIGGLYENSALGELLVLKGGNALRKGYFPATRFSDDLDFTTTRGLDGDLLMREFNEICRFAEARSGVKFDVDRNQLVGEQLIDRAKRVYKLRLYFRDFTGNADHIHPAGQSGRHRVRPHLPAAADEASDPSVLRRLRL